jgi:indole-3-glycerol phosphate synthase
VSDVRPPSADEAVRPPESYGQPSPGGFLTEMIASSRRRVAAARAGGGLRRPEQPAQPGRLREALTRPSGTPGAPNPQLAVIAEVKRRSPSRGDIAPELDAVTQARAYQAAGADAVSVLTEPTRFGGSLDDLRAVCGAVDLPVLRKDFVVDKGQIWEAAEAGAAAVLLIVAILNDDRLHELLLEALDCGLDPLVEVHDLDETRRASRAGCTLVGINNRDLVTLDVDIATTEHLAPALGPCMFPVSESGISTATDACRAALAGARAVLVGETLVRTPTDALPELIARLKDPGWPA